MSRCCNKNRPKHAKDCLNLPTFDYIVVGAGTAGAPLAKHLSDDPSVSVLILEPSINRQDDPRVLDLDQTVLRASPELHWHTPIDYSPVVLTPPATNYTEGFLWGGSSGHNFLLAVRGSPCLYDKWAAIHCQWGYEELRPAMQYVETYTPRAGNPFNAEERGDTGRVFVTQDPFTSLLDSPAFVNAFATEGISYSLDYNDPSRGVNVLAEGQLTFNPNTFTRSWAGIAFLGPDVVITLPNGDGRGANGRRLEIQSKAFVTRVLFEDELAWDGDQLTAVGVEYEKDGIVHKVLARCKIILCAGGVHTPALLMRSGIGPRDNLRDIGIRTRLVNEHVGRGQNHYGPTAIIPKNEGDTLDGANAYFPDPNDDECRGYQTIIFTSATVSDALDVLAFDMQPNMCLQVVATSSVDPDGVRIIQNPYEDKEDRENAIQMLKTIARISLAYTGQMPIQPPASTYPISEFGAQGGQAFDDSELFDYLLERTIYTNHISGTAKMSQNRCDGVVDGNLDVHEVKNLGIADTSIMPVIVDGNTSMAAYYIGLTKAKIEGAPVPF